ncbi:MAG: efflux RND transporter periplasmic adaptor subunit [Saprospiraceae bacterium]
MKKIIPLIACLLLGLVLGKFLWVADPMVQDQISSGEEVPLIYTCSMHPQIRQPEPGLCPLCAMELIPLDQANSSSENLFAFTMKPSAVAMANIQTAIYAKEGQVIPAEREIYLSGRIAIDEDRLSTISSNVGGRLDAFGIAYEGQYIQKGQKIGSLHAPELVSAQQELRTTMKMKDQEPALYQAARTKLKNWQLTEVQIDQIEDAPTLVDQIDITADQSGIVISRLVQLGDFLKKGQPLLRLVELDRVWVELEAYEQDLPLLENGQQVRFSTPSFPGQIFSGTISFIEPLMDAKTRTAKVRLSVLNKGRKLKPEMLVDAVVTVPLKGREQVRYLPKSAVLWTGKRSIVYLQKGVPDLPEFEMREVTLGETTNEGYEVIKGLQEGDKYVVNGVFVVDAAAQLNGKYSMINRPQTPIIEISDEFRATLNSLLDLYFDIKNELVKSDFKRSMEVVQTFNQQLETLTIPLEIREDWQPFGQTLKDRLMELSATTDLEGLRNEFAGFSDQMTSLVGTFELGEAEVYVDFCPMAMNDQGAYWLSEFKNIENPYFGSAMLTCGLVKRTFSGATR